MKTYQVNEEGFYGNFGGAYIPEILHQCVEELKDNYRKVLDSEEFQQEFAQPVTRLCRTSFTPLSGQTPLGKIRMQDLSETGGPESYRSA